MGVWNGSNSISKVRTGFPFGKISMDNALSDVNISDKHISSFMRLHFSECFLENGFWFRWAWMSGQNRAERMFLNYICLHELTLGKTTNLSIHVNRGCRLTLRKHCVPEQTQQRWQSQIKAMIKGVTTFLFQWLPQIIKQRMTMSLRNLDMWMWKRAGLKTGEMIGDGAVPSCNYEITCTR